KSKAESTGQANGNTVLIAAIAGDGCSAHQEDHPCDTCECKRLTGSARFFSRPQSRRTSKAVDLPICATVSRPLAGLLQTWRCEFQSHLQKRSWLYRDERSRKRSTPSVRRISRKILCLERVRVEQRKSRVY